MTRKFLHFLKYFPNNTWGSYGYELKLTSYNKLWNKYPLLKYLQTSLQNSDTKFKICIFKTVFILRLTPRQWLCISFLSMFLNDTARDDWWPWRKFSPSPTSSTINPTQTDLKLNLGLCSDKTASNCLGHHTVFYFFMWGSSKIFERIFELQIILIASVSSSGNRLIFTVCVYTNYWHN